MTDAKRASRTVFLVDDDVAVCNALSALLEASGYSVRTFRSAEAFLDENKDANSGVMLLDQRMAGMSGLELQAQLARRGIDLPIIFITGHGDVPMSVKALKAGAIDFLEKPFSYEVLLECLDNAFLRAAASKDCIELRRRITSLTRREQEVLRYVVAGLPNKKIAELLDLSSRTIEAHRYNVMKKMGAESLPDLVRKYAMCQHAGL